MAIKIENYNINLNIDIENKILKGEEIIELFILEKSENIKIDAIDLKVNDVQIINNKNSKEKILWYFSDNKIVLENKFNPGYYKIFVNFENALKNTPGGFYLVEYEKNKFLFTTLFSPLIYDNNL